MEGSGSGIREAEKHKDPDIHHWFSCWVFFLNSLLSCYVRFPARFGSSSKSKSYHQNTTAAEKYELCFVTLYYVQFTEFCTRVLAKLWHLEQNWSHQGHLHRASEKGCPHSCYERYCNKLRSVKIKYCSSHNHAPAGHLPLEPPLYWSEGRCACEYTADYI